MASKGTNAVAGNSTQIFLSNDNGVVWGNITNNLASLGLSINDATFDQMGNIFAATSGGVYISSDNGLTWSHRGLNSVYKIASRGSRLFAGSYGNILTSDDYGNNWTSHYVDQNNLNQVMTIVPSGGFVFSSIGKKVYYSTNNGNSWDAFSTPLLSDVSSLAIRDTVLVAGTRNHGAWKCPISVISEVKNQLSDLADWKIAPNPGQNGTSLEFSEGFIGEVGIYSITGSKIWEKKVDQGNSRIELKLKPGVYLARVGSASGIRIQRIVIE